MAKTSSGNGFSKDFSKKNILFVMHTRITHFLEIFRDFTSPQCSYYTIIDHPLYPIAGTKSKLIIHKNGRIKKKMTKSRIAGPYTVNFIKDFFLTIFWGIKTGVVYDIGFGTNNLNTLSLLTLKKLGRVKKVIFISIDYTPNRYDNQLLNWCYHLFDRICCYNSDVIWNSSVRMNEARVKKGVDPKKIVKTIVMPDGSNFDHRKRLPLSQIDRKKIIFSGHMRPVMGVDLILKSFKDILRDIPDAKLILTGSGPKLEDYRKLAHDLDLDQQVLFTGFIKRHADLDDVLRKGAVGLALFAPDKSSYEYYSDVGKPKAYLAAGMPVIITRVPQIADEIEEKKAGVIVAYDKNELTKAIIKFLKNDEFYKAYRKNAINLSRKYIWTNIFRSTFKETLSYLNKRVS